MPEPCADGKNCFWAVTGRRDHPDAPIYPVVSCAGCQTQWFGHRIEARIPDPRIPEALRDAILLDQFENFERILHDLGYRKLSLAARQRDEESYKEVHTKISAFLREEFSRSDACTWMNLDLRFMLASHREQQLHRWSRDDMQPAASEQQIDTLTANIIEIAEAEVGKDPTRQHQFLLRFTNSLAARHTLAFTITLTLLTEDAAA